MRVLAVAPEVQVAPGWVSVAVWAYCADEEGKIYVEGVPLEKLPPEVRPWIHIAAGVQTILQQTVRPLLQERGKEDAGEG